MVESRCRYDAGVGYALRKGLANATPGASMVSKVSERFIGQRPKRTTPSRGSRISKATTTNAFTAFSPTSPYAYRETDITRLVQGVCDHGIRINTDVLTELRADDGCSETVKSVSRALVGGRGAGYPPLGLTIRLTGVVLPRTEMPGSAPYCDDTAHVRAVGRVMIRSEP